jgi:glycosyltransferase involved in cell wall biosynthesis
MVRELNLGGCERDLTKVAIGLDRGQFTPFVGCFHPHGFRFAELRSAQVPVIQFAVKSFASPTTLNVARQFGRFIAENKIQIVHAFDVPSNIFAVPAARWFRVPTVISSDLQFRELVPKLHRRMLRLVDALAHKTVVNSDAVRRSLIAHQGVPAAKIYLSHNGVDTSLFYPAPAQGKPRFFEDSLVIGTLCALRSEKRVDLLIDAFAQLRRLRSDAKLLIVGSGAMLPSLQQQARSKGVEQFCLFQPATPDVAAWLRMMDTFVLTSESESFPNVLLEAMACGRCVVASNVGGVPELVTDGVNGLTFPIGDAAALAACLIRLAQDPALRSTLATAAAQTARQNFKIELAVERLQDLYLSSMISHRS